MRYLYPPHQGLIEGNIGAFFEKRYAVRATLCPEPSTFYLADRVAKDFVRKSWLHLLHEDEEIPPRHSFVELKGKNLTRGKQNLRNFLNLMTLIRARG